MQRRQFIQTSVQSTAVASAAACGLAVAAPIAPAARQLYEWRTYRLDDAAKQDRVHQFLKSAFIPAWQRMGMGPVSVFTEIGPDAGPSIHVLLVYPTFDFAEARETMERDADFQEAAATYHAAKKDDPAFERIDSSLMIAFMGATSITPPKQKPRVLELRTYESFNEERARAKVDMFNDGEISIFPKCGFENVFFGETLVGADLPNLKYMLASVDMAANEANWKAFLAHPDFLRMKDDPKYADTVSRITRLYLTPTDYSQV